jgi:rubrerythrin
MKIKMEWCGRLETEMEELEHASEISKSIEDKTTQEISEVADFEMLEGELKEMKQQLKSDMEKFVLAGREIARAEETWFAQVQKKAKYARWVERISAVRELDMETYSGHYFCNVCSQKICTSILKKCSHPMCKDCANDAVVAGHCPICKTPTKEDHIIRFFYTP